jgi:hypothetical protein
VIPYPLRVELPTVEFCHGLSRDSCVFTEMTVYLMAVREHSFHLRTLSLAVSYLHHCK